MNTMSNDGDRTLSRREEMEDFDAYWGRYTLEPKQRADPPPFLSIGLPSGRCGYDDLVQTVGPAHWPMSPSVSAHDGEIIDVPTSSHANCEPAHQCLQPEIRAQMSRRSKGPLLYCIFGLLVLLAVLIVIAIFCANGSTVGAGNHTMAIRPGDKIPGGKSRANDSLQNLRRSTAADETEPQSTAGSPTPSSDLATSPPTTMPHRVHMPSKVLRPFVAPPAPVEPTEVSQSQDVDPPEDNLPFGTPQLSSIGLLDSAITISPPQQQPTKPVKNGRGVKAIFTGLAHVFSPPMKSADQKIKSKE